VYNVWTLDNLGYQNIEGRLLFVIYTVCLMYLWLYVNSCKVVDEINRFLLKQFEARAITGSTIM